MKLAIAALMLCLGACASLLPKLEAPRIEVAAVELGGGNLDKQQIRLRLHASNPNDRQIAVRGIECTLELAGNDFAQGSTDTAFVLPARGEADFDISVTANMNGALAALAANLGRNTLDYRIYGRVHLQTGVLRTLSFDEKGRVRLW